jgi:hypothetical protein
MYKCRYLVHTTNFWINLYRVSMLIGKPIWIVILYLYLPGKGLWRRYLLTVIKICTTVTKKESLNSGDQQLHQYQRTSHLNWLKTKKWPLHKTLEIDVLAWDGNKNMAVLNRLMGSQFSSIHYIRYLQGFVR